MNAETRLKCFNCCGSTAQRAQWRRCRRIRRLAVARIPLLPLVGEGGRAQLGRMRGVPAWRRRRSVQHPSSVLALRANPPSP
ncbi:MAG: hypothetical protein EOR91_32855, partial [Mesorhizobium sp.]